MQATYFRILYAVVLIINLVAAPSQAAVKAGAKCPRIGKLAIAGGFEYKCVKKKQGLIWQKLRTIKMAPSVNNSNPTPTSSPTADKKVLPDFWPLTSPANDDLVLIADANVRRYISSANTLPRINLLTGPNTNKEGAKNYLKYLERAAIGWGKDWMPEEVDVAIASVQDYEWISQLWPKYGLTGGFDSSRSNWERNGNQCNQGSAIYDSKPFFWGCLPDSSVNVIGFTKFGPHEYTHLAQNAIIYYQSGKRVWNLPSLFSEGSADFYGVTYASNAADAKSNWNDYWAGGYISTEARIALKQADAAEIESLLMDAMLYSRKANSHWYWTGAYATMRLIAAKGHEGFLKFMRSTGESQNVFSSFESIYGMKFEEFAKIIAPEIKLLTAVLRS
jgi:hypothetical protein